MGVNAREIVLDILLALEREEDYSHRLIKAVLDKYDYLEGREKAFIKRVTEGTLERGLELDHYLNHFSSLPVGKMRPLIRCLMPTSFSIWMPCRTAPCATRPASWPPSGALGG